MAAGPSRFADWPAWAARLLLALFLLVSVWGATTAIEPVPASKAATVDLTDTDLALYQAVAGRVGAGEGYYETVVAEQRTRGYPLRPVFTVRLPTLAWILGTVGVAGAALLLKLLMVAAVGALTIRMRSVAGSRLPWGAAAFLAASAMVLLTVPAMTFWHEAWAALLIVLSLACRVPGRWLSSLIFGLLAALIRELALPYLCVMAVLAWREGEKREAVAWAGAVLLFFPAMGAHALALSAHVTAADPASPGWSGGGGWPFVLSMMQRCSLFLFLPLPVVALLVPLSLLGWAGLRGALADRVVFLLCGYLLAFTILGRPDNFYWGLLVAPLLPAGLAFAPRALRDLVRRLQILNPEHRRVTG